MTLNRIGLLVSLLVFCLAAYLLATGSDLLVYPISENRGIPMGTLITWLGFLSLPGILYFAFPGIREPKGRVQGLLRRVWLLGLVLAVAWPFVSYCLAANWSYSFEDRPAFRGSSRASVYFWGYCIFLAAWPLPLLLALLLNHLLSGTLRD